MDCDIKKSLDLKGQRNRTGNGYRDSERYIKMKDNYKMLRTNMMIYHKNGRKKKVRDFDSGGQITNETIISPGS